MDKVLSGFIKFINNNKKEGVNLIVDTVVNVMLSTKNNKRLLFKKTDSNFDENDDAENNRQLLKTDKLKSLLKSKINSIQDFKIDIDKLKKDKIQKGGEKIDTMGQDAIDKVFAKLDISKVLDDPSTFFKMTEKVKGMWKAMSDAQDMSGPQLKAKFENMVKTQYVKQSKEVFKYVKNNIKGWINKNNKTNLIIMQDTITVKITEILSEKEYKTKYLGDIFNPLIDEYENAVKISEGFAKPPGGFRNDKPRSSLDNEDTVDKVNDDKDKIKEEKAKMKTIIGYIENIYDTAEYAANTLKLDEFYYIQYYETPKTVGKCAPQPFGPVYKITQRKWLQFLGTEKKQFKNPFSSKPEENYDQYVFFKNPCDKRTSEGPEGLRRTHRNLFSNGYYIKFNGCSDQEFVILDTFYKGISYQLVTGGFSEPQSGIEKPRSSIDVVRADKRSLVKSTEDEDTIEGVFRINDVVRITLTLYTNDNFSGSTTSYYGVIIKSNSSSNTVRFYYPSGKINISLNKEIKHIKDHIYEYEVEFTNPKIRIKPDFSYYNYYSSIKEKGGENLTFVGIEKLSDVDMRKEILGQGDIIKGNAIRDGLGELYDDLFKQKMFDKECYFVFENKNGKKNYLKTEHYYKTGYPSQDEMSNFFTFLPNAPIPISNNTVTSTLDSTAATTSPQPDDRLNGGKRKNKSKKNNKKRKKNRGKTIKKRRKITRS